MSEPERYQYVEDPDLATQPGQVVFKGDPIRLEKGDRLTMTYEMVDGVMSPFCEIVVVRGDQQRDDVSSSDNSNN